MGYYINSVSSYNNFKNLCMKKYFVDKTGIITKFNELIDVGNEYICITRPRRFGKTKLEDMLVAYYSKELDSRELFDKLKIANGFSDDEKVKKEERDCYERNIGKYTTIHIDFSDRIRKYKSLNEYIDKLSLSISKELKECYNDVDIDCNGDLIDNLIDIFIKKQERFIFILDEWDYIFNNNLFTENEREDFLVFLKDLLKDKGYVAFAYMTGVLPIAKHSSGSAINMFKEYTMFKGGKYSEYLGFTLEEVKRLCDKQGKISYEELADWYNGYKVNIKDENDETKEVRIFNPRSVINALEENELV